MSVVARLALGALLGVAVFQAAVALRAGTDRDLVFGCLFAAIAGGVAVALFRPLG